MKITSVEQQKKSSKGRSATGRNPRRFNIFLDGKFAFGVDEDLLIERRLLKGKEISAEDLEKIIFEAEVGKLVGRVYGLLNIRLRTEKEVRDYIRNLSFKRKLKDEEEVSEVVIESLVEKLKQKDLINDERFAREWVRARRLSKKKGDIALKMELYQKGIERGIVERVLGEEGEESQEELAAQALEKKMRSLNLYPEIEKKKKGVDFLMRRGFDFSTAKKVVDKFLEKE